MKRAMAEEQIAMAKMGGGAGLTVAYGLTLQEWLAAVSILYFILQIILLLPKIKTLIKNWLVRWKGEDDTL